MHATVDWMVHREKFAARRGTGVGVRERTYVWGPVTPQLDLPSIRLDSSATQGKGEGARGARTARRPTRARYWGTNWPARHQGCTHGYEHAPGAPLIAGLRLLLVQLDDPATRRQRRCTRHARDRRIPRVAMSTERGLQPGRGEGQGCERTHPKGH